MAWDPSGKAEANFGEPRRGRGTDSGHYNDRLRALLDLSEHGQFSGSKVHQDGHLATKVGAVVIVKGEGL
jgi:hypothetical protein